MDNQISGRLEIRMTVCIGQSSLNLSRISKTIWLRNDTVYDVLDRAEHFITDGKRK